MTYDDNTDNSWLDCELTPEPAKAKTTKTVQAKTDRKFQWGPEHGQKISQAQLGHQRHTDASRRAISEFHRQTGVRNLRSPEVAALRIEGIRRSRANPSDKLKALWASGNPRWLEASILAKQKPIWTPFGACPSLKHASEFALANGLVNAYKKIGKWLKTNPTEYYYLPKETK